MRVHRLGLLRNLRHLTTFLIIVGILSGSSVFAQTFDSTSTGIDGALDLSDVASGTTILFDPASFNPPLDQDGDNVYNFTTVTIPAGVTVRLSAEILGSIPVVWLATGAVQIDGTISLNGENGHGRFALAVPSVAGAGGWGGGRGRRSLMPAQPGNGPGGGLVSSSSGGGGGYATVGGGGIDLNVGGAAYGNDFLLPLLGGSGGAGGSGQGSSDGGGGAGGGAILIASSVSITINGLISATGGLGIQSGSGHGGGGGSGGAVRLMAPTITGSGGVFALGGAGPTGAGNNGSSGRIRLEAFQHSISSSNISPTPVVVTPGIIFPPANTPSVRVVKVAGVDVPPSPTGSFLMPDVTLDDVTVVTIEIEAKNIPAGTIVELTITPETGPQQLVDSTPLEGTLAMSTATAEVALPHGFSRFFVQANWVP